ncbi:hypothetical protein [Oleiagrimonas sp. MCCC 1A03011]|uniref:hypothetical protein n=1 Tax=Oleiagrimonas sp. MCCC 1A03011 TaxID=1926883 RepID=UPI000DC3DA8B|nr:hypothetical protein [Oleiagrimonas sp. MCCC 1A03011]RAP56881.1 hypothetical protein BTJ49_12075 [Oleiagrimonas sp. MCCC 1A03011]
MSKTKTYGWLRACVALLALAVALPAVAGDVGGQVYSNPGTITMRLTWGSNYENSKDVSISGNGAYSFGVNIRNNTKFRVESVSAPSGWACRGKQGNVYLSNASASDTNIYCGTASSVGGVRIGSWNLEWYDSSDPAAKKQAIADVINGYHFDVMEVNEILDAASIQDLIDNYLGNASDWDFRITQAGCSQHDVILWRKSAVSLQSGYDLNAADTNGLIDENGSTWDDCAGRRPYVATFAVNNSALTFTMATIHFKAGSSPSDCQLRKDQVDSFVQWADESGVDQGNFIAAGDFNDELVGDGECKNLDTLTSMESHAGMFFATAQPGYNYAYMMGNGLVTYDTKSYQSTVDQFWMSTNLRSRMQPTDTYGDLANAVEANMYFAPWGEPDHDAPYISLAK